MKGATIFYLLAGLTAAGASAAAALVGFEVIDLRGSWPMQAGLTTLAAALGASAFALAAWRFHSLYAPVQRFLDDMARIDAAGALISPNAFPCLPSGHPLGRAARQIRDSYATLVERLDSLEQSRVAIDVRCRRAVQESERIRNVLAGMAEPILAVDQYDELVMANASARAMFDIDDTAERALRQLVHCEKLVELLSSTAHRKTAGCRTEELELTDGDGQSRWFQVTAAKLAADDPQDANAGHGAVAVLRDISDRKALQKRNAEFVSAVSHEMKTPLAGIRAYVELLADGDAEDEATREEFLEIINGQTDRLQRLIDNLLNLARIEAGVVEVHKQSQSLNEVLEEALRLVRPSAEAKDITLTDDLSPLYLSVLVDRDMILQAAINLLSNAIKYTHKGGSVTLRSRMVDDEIRFEVQDTGVGLSAEDARKVFEKFYRVKKDKEMAAGTGLGLALAKHIVEDVHGGRIVVASQPGEGSTFAIVLPNAGQRLSVANAV
jgi:two-component system phosphate regulon sensor histidine kinase PhoR